MSYTVNSTGNTLQSITTTITATASQTVFTTQFGYILGYIGVVLNSQTLVPEVDFQASNGSTITLTTPANAGATVQLISYVPIGLSDMSTEVEASANFKAAINSINSIQIGTLTPAAGTFTTINATDQIYQNNISMVGMGLILA